MCPRGGQGGPERDRARQSHGPRGRLYCRGRHAGQPGRQLLSGAGSPLRAARRHDPRAARRPRAARDLRARDAALRRGQEVQQTPHFGRTAALPFHPLQFGFEVPLFPVDPFFGLRQFGFDFFQLADFRVDLGFERGLAEDALSVRLFAQKCPEVIVASSCSKNFAVYRERTGALSVLCQTAQKADDVVTVINALTRKNYSMPPTHGPGIIDIILHSDDLTAMWLDEVTIMRDRINGLRSTLVGKIAAAGIEEDFSLLAQQSGMFSFLGLSVDQVRRLREEFSIYTVDSARINIASFNNDNIDYFVNALKAVL